MSNTRSAIFHRLIVLLTLLAFLFTNAPLQAALSQTRERIIFQTKNVVTEHEYDDAGRVSSRTDFNGTVTQFGYDAVNRLLTRTSNHPQAGAGNVAFTYTASGQRATMTDASGVTNYGYDARDRLTTKATPRGTISQTSYTDLRYIN